MAMFVIVGDQLELRMGALEHVAALHKDVSVPLSSVERVEVVSHAWEAVNGDRTGTDAPGLLLAGRFKGPHGLTIAVCHRSRPGVAVYLTGTDPHALIASVDDPEETATQIQQAAGLTS